MELPTLLVLLFSLLSFTLLELGLSLLDAFVFVLLDDDEMNVPILGGRGAIKGGTGVPSDEVIFTCPSDADAREVIFPLDGREFPGVDNPLAGFEDAG